MHAINLSLSTDLVDPYGENTFSVKPPLAELNSSIEIYQVNDSYMVNSYLQVLKEQLAELNNLIELYK